MIRDVLPLYKKGLINRLVAADYDWMICPPIYDTINACSTFDSQMRSCPMPGQTISTYRSVLTSLTGSSSPIFPNSVLPRHTWRCQALNWGPSWRIGTPLSFQDPCNKELLYFSVGNQLDLSLAE